MLTRKEILAADDLTREEVEVPEWGGTVFVSEMTGEARDEYESSLIGEGDSRLHNIRAKLVAATVVDKNGKRLFSESDVAALGKKSGDALDRIWVVANRLSALREGDVKALAKNSSSAPDDDSTSA